MDRFLLWIVFAFHFI